MNKTIKLLAILLAALSMLAASSVVASAAPVWNVESEALPSAFTANDGVGNDAYDIEVENLGDTTSSGTITVVDHLPAGITTTQTPTDATSTHNAEPSQWSCSSGAGQTVVTCTATAAVAPATATYNVTGPSTTASYIDAIAIPVTIADATAATATNAVTVSGGGALDPASTDNDNPVGLGPDTAFGTSFFNLRVIGSDGEPSVQAGEHPYALTTDFEFDQEVRPGITNAAGIPEHYANVATGDEARTVVAELPLGLIGDPQAAPQCSLRQFTEGANGIGAPGDNTSNCPADTAVGTVFVDRPDFDGPYQLFNLTPEPGHAAQFGLHFGTVPVVLYGDVVHSDRGYVLRVTALLPQAKVHGISLTFFGDPAAAFDTGKPQTPFLTNPVDCAASEAQRTLSLHIDSWTAPGLGDPFEANFSDPNWVPASALLAAEGGCEALKFEKSSLSLAPAGTTQADKPSGYDVNLKVPQTEAFSELATPELKTATVALPAGVSVSPSAANGLQACSDEQIDLESSQAGSCPLASQLGTVKIVTPLLATHNSEGEVSGPEPLEGAVFLGQPECSPCSEADASEGKTFRLFIEARDEARGVTIKLPGKVRANPTTGQLTAEFAENPQLPFSDLELDFKNGPRAPLANPQSCGSYTTSSTLTPWSEPQTAAVVFPSTFAITGCGATTPFTPGFIAGTTNQTPGGATGFSVTFTRNDGEQDLGGITVHTPPGLLGKIAGVPRCGEAEANTGTCSAASEIGTTTVQAGPGSDPYTITGGRVYLTNGYKGAPFGLAIMVPTKAGPFTLAGNTGRGEEVVRAAIAVNPTTAALTITSDPLPQVIDGVPLRLRSVTVEVNRANFMVNATNCTEQSIGSTITSAQGASSSPGSPYAPSGCKNLAFSPSFSATTEGKASALKEGDGASLNVKIASPAGQANIKRVDVTLPTQLPARLIPTLQNACSEAQFATNPAGCPPDSFVGTATAVTPILGVPLSGSAIFVSHGGEAFPDLDLVLQGEGVTIILTGHTLIQGDTTYSRFETVPDAPISSFELNLPEGPHSALASSLATSVKSLCGQTLNMPTMIEGQNGAVVNQATAVAISGCGPIMKVVSHNVNQKTRTATILVKVPSAGRIVATGKDLTKASKSTAKAKTVTLKLKLTKKGKAALKAHPDRALKINAKLVFTPKSGKKLSKTVTLTFGHNKKAKAKTKKAKAKKKAKK